MGIFTLLLKNFCGGKTLKQAWQNIKLVKQAGESHIWVDITSYIS